MNNKYSSIKLANHKALHSCTFICLDSGSTQTHNTYRTGGIGTFRAQAFIPKNE